MNGNRLRGGNFASLLNEKQDTKKNTNQSLAEPFFPQGPLPLPLPLVSSSRTLIKPTNFHNKNNLLHQNLGSNILNENVREYTLVISSADRDYSKSPSPFDFQVNIGSSVFANPQEVLDEFGNAILDIRKKPIIIQSVNQNLPGPSIKADIKEVSYAYLQKAILPKSYAFKQENLLSNKVADSNILMMENDSYLTLDIKELVGSLKYGTNDKVTDSFAVLTAEREQSRKFFFNAVGENSPVEFKTPLKKLNTLTIKLRGSNGEILNFPYLQNNCACCIKKNCQNNCCIPPKSSADSEIKKEKESSIENLNVKMASVIMSTNLVLVNNYSSNFSGKFNSATFTDNSNYSLGIIDWKLTGSVVSPPLNEPLVVTFNGNLNGGNYNIGKITYTFLGNDSVFDYTIKYNKNEFEAYINGSIGDFQLQLTAKGYWAKNSKHIVFLLYGMIGGVYISVPIEVPDLTNISTTPIEMNIMDKQIIGNISTELLNKSNINYGGINSDIQPFKSVCNVAFNFSKNTTYISTNFTIEGTWDSSKKVLKVELIGTLGTDKYIGSGSMFIDSKNVISGTVTLIHGNGDKTFTFTAAGIWDPTNSTATGTLNGMVDLVAFNWNFGAAITDNFETFQFFINGTIGTDPFNLGISTSTQVGLVSLQTTEKFPQGYVGGNILISSTNTIIKGSMHHSNYLPNKYTESTILSFFDTATGSLLYEVNFGVFSDVKITYSQLNLNTITTISISGNYSGSVLLKTANTVTPFNGSFSAVIDMSKSNIIINIGGANVNLIIKGNLTGNYLNTGTASAASINNGTIIGKIIDNSSATLVDLNGTITGTVIKGILYATITNNDASVISFTFNTNQNIVLDKKTDQKQIIEIKKNNPATDTGGKKKACCDCLVNPKDPRLQCTYLITLGMLEADFNIKTPVMR